MRDQIRSSENCGWERLMEAIASRSSRRVPARDAIRKASKSRGHSSKDANRPRPFLRARSRDDSAAGPGFVDWLSCRAACLADAVFGRVRTSAAAVPDDLGEDGVSEIAPVFDMKHPDCLHACLPCWLTARSGLGVRSCVAPG